MNKTLRLSLLSLLLVLTAIITRNAKASNFSASTDAVNKYTPASNISKNDNVKSNIYVGIGVGTTGPSLVGAFYFNNLIGIRAEYSGIPQYFANMITEKYVDNNSAIKDKILGVTSDNIKSFALSGVDINSKVSFQSWGFDLSVRPFRGIWRLDAGIRNVDYSVSAEISPYINSSDLQATASSLAGDAIRDYDINIGRLLNTKDGIKLTASAEVVLAKGWKPYFGTGWDFNLGKGFTVSLDAGVIYLGDPMRITRLTIDADNIQLNRPYIEEKIIETVINSIGNLKDIPVVPDSMKSFSVSAINFNKNGTTYTVYSGKQFNVSDNVTNSINSVSGNVNVFRDQKSFDDLENWSNSLRSSLNEADNAISEYKNSLLKEVEQSIKTNMQNVNATAGTEVFNQQDINDRVNEAKAQVNNAFNGVPKFGDYAKEMPDVSKYRADADRKLDDMLGDFNMDDILKTVRDNINVDEINSMIHDINIPYINTTSKTLMKFWPVVKLSFGWRFNIG